jgi:hypothetical protein
MSFLCLVKRFPSCLCLFPFGQGDQIFDATKDS